MAKIKLNYSDVKETVNALTLYRSGWANDIREGCNCRLPGVKEINFELYEISGSIILALQQIMNGNYRDKMAMFLVKDKLEKLVKSDNFDELSAMTEAGMCRVITSGTKHHIRVMFECLEVLTA